MTKILDIFATKLDLTPDEHRDVKTWIVDLDADRNTLNNITTTAGGGAGISQGNVEIDFASGITLKNPSSGARSIYLDPDGDAWFGKNIDNPIDTTLFIVSNNQRYDGQSYGEGDLLIGSHRTGKANIWWDASAGKLYFRNGTTISGSIGGGDIVFERGTIGGWTITATKLSSTNIDLDSGNEKITIGSDMTFDGSASTITAGSIVLDGTNDDLSIGTSLVFDGATEKLTVGSGSPNIVIDGTNALVKSSNFSDEAAGWQIDKDGNAQFNSATIRGRVSSAVFEYEAVSAVSGGFAVAKSASQITEDVVSADPSFNLKVYASQGGTELFEVSDIIRVKYWDGSAIVDFWGIVGGLSTAAGVTTLAVTQATGTPGLNLQAGAAVVNYGESTRGLIFLEAGDPTDDTDPKGRMRIATHAGAPYTTMTNALVLGDMYNTYGTGANHRYGIGIGDHSSGNYLSYNAETANEMIFSSADGGITINPTSGLTLYDNADNVNFITFRQLTTEERIGDIYGDYGGGDQAATFIRSHRTASSAWDRTYVALALDDDEFSLDARISLEQVSAGDTIGAARIGNSGLSVERGLNVGSYDNTIAVGHGRFSGALYLGDTPLQTQSYGLYLDATSGDYGFVWSPGNMHVGTNTYWDGVSWKALKAGKGGYFGNSTSAPFHVYFDNTSRSANGANTFTKYMDLQTDGILNINTGGLKIKGTGTMAGTGLELFYSGSTGYIFPYDRGATAYKYLEVRGKNVKITDQDGTTTTNFAGGDVYGVPWTFYGSTSTVSGFSGFTVKSIYYKTLGDTVYVAFFIQGTSNQTYFTFTVPFANHSGVTQQPIIRCSNNGAPAVAGLLSLATSSTICYCYPTPAAGNWTASGTKYALGQFWYHRA